MPLDLVKEMARVTKTYLVIITHGKPTNRSPIFKSQLEGEWEEHVIECELSAQAQLINVIRSKFPGSSIKDIIHDTEKLKTCLNEMAAAKNSRQVADSSSTLQNICWVYLYKRLSN